MLERQPWQFLPLMDSLKHILMIGYSTVTLNYLWHTIHLSHILSGFAMDDGSSMGPLSHSCHSGPPPALADPQPLPGTDQQERHLWREGITVAALQVHEGQVRTNWVLLHTRVTGYSSVSHILWHNIIISMASLIPRPFETEKKRSGDEASSYIDTAKLHSN